MLHVVFVKKLPSTEQCLRIDKGYLRGVLDLLRQSITMIVIIVYYSYTERVYFSLINDVYLILICQDLR